MGPLPFPRQDLSTSKFKISRFWDILRLVLGILDSDLKSQKWFMNTTNTEYYIIFKIDNEKGIHDMYLQFLAKMCGVPASDTVWWPKECSHFIEHYSVPTQDISKISSHSFSVFLFLNTKQKEICHNLIYCLNYTHFTDCILLAIKL